MSWALWSRRCCTGKNFPCKFIQDESLLSLSLTKITPISTRWPLDPAFGFLQDDSTFVVHSHRLSQNTACWRSADCDGSILSPWVDSAHLAPISRYLEKDCHLCTIENLTLSFRFWPRPDLSMLERSEFQLNPQFTGLYDIPEYNMGDRFAVKLLDVKLTDLDVATTSSSPVFLSCIVLFDMVFGFSNESNWLRENIEKFMMLHKRRRLFHSARVKLPLVNNVSELFFLSNLIRILGSRLILSNNQSKRNSVGSGHVSHRRLQPFMNSWSLLRCVQNSTTELRWQTWSDHSSTSRLPRLFDLVLVLMLWISLLCTVSRHLDHRPFLFDSDLLLLDGCFFSKNAILFSPHPTEKKARIPSIRKPASREKSDSVELWDTDVSFLHIQLTGTKCSNFQEKKWDSPWCWFRIFKVSSKIWVLEETQSTVLSCVQHICVGFLGSR